MRLAVDLFACQTKFRFRGISRYSLSVTSEMASQRGANNMFVLANALIPESFEELRQKFIRLLPAGSFLPFYHLPVNFQFL